MRHKDDLFEYTMRELEKKGQAELALHFHHQRMLEEFNQKQDTEKMKREIIEEVLSRISVRVEETVSETLNRVFAEFERS